MNIVEIKLLSLKERKINAPNIQRFEICEPLMTASIFFEVCKLDVSACIRVPLAVRILVSNPSTMMHGTYRNSELIAEVAVHCVQLMTCQRIRYVDPLALSA